MGIFGERPQILAKAEPKWTISSMEAIANDKVLGLPRLEPVLGVPIERSKLY
jgi:hypothetical protein